MNVDRKVILVLGLAAMNFAAIKGTADFVAKATPGFLEIEGTGGLVDGSKAIIDTKNMISGEFTVSLSQLKTGIDERDGHMKSYLEAGKYPTAILKLEPTHVAAGTTKAFKGQFTLHGVTKPVSGTVEFSSTNAVAKFNVDVTQYGIKVPSYKLLTVGKDVEIKVKIDI